MVTAWVSIAISIVSLIFAAGVFYGEFRAERRRLRVRIRDLERAYASIGNRTFVSKFPEQ